MLPSVLPKGKQGLLSRQGPNPDHPSSTAAPGDKGTSPLQPEGVHAEDRQQVGDVRPGSPVVAEPDGEGTSIQGDKGTRGQVDKETSPSHQKRTDYEKKGYYVGLRHQDTLDDLARALRRHGLPDDRSMIVRALIDAAGRSHQSGNAEWLNDLAALCRQTLPGTTKK